MKDINSGKSFVSGRAALTLFLCLSLSPDIHAKAVSSQKDSILIFFPENRLFPDIFLDPLECQVMGGSYFLTQKEMDLILYSTVNFGFNKPVFSKKGKYYSWELSFGAAAYTQFDLMRNGEGSYLAGLMNSDFKISGDYAVRRKNNLLRFRIFHISSHLGDDYMQRHSDTLTNDKSGNYEQADLTYMRKYGNSYFYAGAGGVYNKYAFRERLSFQAGGLLNFRNTGAVNLFSGIDLKVLAENDFNPDIRTAFGVSFNRKSESLIRIWAEYYSGRLPYSTIDYGRVNWYGLAMMFSIF